MTKLNSSGHSGPLRCRSGSTRFIMLAAALCLTCLCTACSRDDGNNAQVNQTSRQAANTTAATHSSASDTPVGTSMPRSALPMPPVTAAPENAASAAASSSALAWTQLDNRRARLADYKGQVVVLDFYATWCPPCREETPHLVALHRRYGKEGLRVVGLNVGGDEDIEQVPGFVEEFGIPYALGFPDTEMTNLFMSDNDSIPQAFVFDRQGRLVRRFVGFAPDMPEELEQTVKAALAGKAG